MRLKSRLLSLTAASGLAATVLAAGPAQHVLAGPPGAPSGYCNDGIGQEFEVPILTSPITLAVELGSNGSQTHPHLGLCYSTTPEGSSNGEAAGGSAGYYVDLGNPTGVNVYSFSDPGAAIQASTDDTVAPTWSIVPGTNGTTGDTIAVSIPFSLCLGGCDTFSPTINPTGLLIGQLVPVAHPGIGAVYELASLQVIVNGVTVVSAPDIPAGAWVDPFGAVADSLSLQQGGPCILNECVPQGYVETTGTTVAEVRILGHSEDVTPPKKCLYTNPQGQCP